jgi:DnaJ like chaperone protein
MQVISILIGTAIGFLIGGPIGIPVGGLVGYFLGQALQTVVIGGLQVAQTDLIETTFSVMGALCKADNVVTRDELQVAEQAFDMLRLGGEQRDLAKAAFNKGKQRDFDLDSAVDRFAAITHGRGPLVQLFLHMQYMVVAADGIIHPAEHSMLVRIAGRLGVGEENIAQLESLLRAGASGAAGTRSSVPTQDRLKDAHIALGVTPESTTADVKRAYRKLISKNHPDKLAARGLPESMRAVAEERSREINSAYDLIKTSRGFV